MQDLFLITAEELRFKRDAQNPHYYILYYVWANAVPVWLEQPANCHHTTLQRHTPPPPAVTREADRNLVNPQLHRELITEEAEIYQNGFNSVMLATYTMAWHTFCNMKVAECHHYDALGPF